MTEVNGVPIEKIVEMCIIGMDVNSLTKLLDSDGIPWRFYKVDHKQYGMPGIFNPYRYNLTVMEGKVTDVFYQ